MISPSYHRLFSYLSDGKLRARLPSLIFTNPFVVRELLKAGKRRFYICSPFAEICPGAISTYNTAGRRGPSSRPAFLCSIGLRSRSQPSMPLIWSVSLSVSDQVIADPLPPEPVFPFAESGNWLNDTLLCHFLQKLRSP